MRKKFFSLLELFITLSILSIIGTSVGVWMHKKIEKTRFDLDCSRFNMTLKLCQNMAIIRQKDLKCSIIYGQSGIKYEVNELVLPKDKNFIYQSSFEINDKKRDKYIIEFAPTLGAVDIEKITLIYKNGKFKKEIYLGLAR